MAEAVRKIKSEETGENQNVMTLKDFLNNFRDILEKKVLESVKPLHDVNGKDDMFTREARERLKNLKRQLFPQQEEAVLALYKGYEYKNLKATNLVAEMGSGKTIMGLAVAYLLNAKRVLVLCPGHLVDKWAREAKETIPSVVVHDLDNRGLGELIDLKVNKLRKPKEMHIFILGQNRAKLHHAVETAYIKTADGMYRCPDCGSIIEDESVIEALIRGKKAKCPVCKTPLYQSTPIPYKRYAKAEFIKRFFKGAFDLLIVDEVHEYKDDKTAQAQAFGYLASASKKILTLTGTLMGGYARDIYFLLWNTVPYKMIEKGFKFYNLSKFEERYGVIEYEERRELQEESEHTYSIGRRDKVMRSPKRRRPGISPELISEFLLDNTVFMKLGDIAKNLPPYNEFIVNVPMDNEQAEVYKAFESSLRDVVSRALARRDKSYLGALVQSLLALPDGARRGEVVRNPHDKEEIVAVAEPVDIDVLPKERKLLEIVTKEKKEGRKVLVCLEHTGTRDLTGDLKERLEKAGFNAVVLKANKVKKRERESWINKVVNDEENPIDVLITNTKVISTGLDLIDFPTIVFFQTGYSVFTLRQASRRSWRIGQEKDVRVYYLVYSDTMQEKALRLVASKMENALAIEGDLTDKGLIALSESENSAIFELARTVISDEKDGDLPDDVLNTLTSKEIESESFIGADESELEETVIKQTKVKKDGKIIATTSTETTYVVRGKVYPKGNKGIAYVNGYKFIFENGKIIYSNKVVGWYKGTKGEINKKPIRIARVKGKNYFALCEVKKIS